MHPRCPYFLSLCTICRRGRVYSFSIVPALSGSLSSLTRLTKISFHDAQITILNAIAGFPLLSDVNIYDCNALTDIQALGTLPSLTLVMIDGCQNIYGGNAFSSQVSSLDELLNP